MMRTEDLAGSLAAKRVNPHGYSIGRHRDGAAVILPEQGSWRLFCFERGAETMQSHHASDPTACIQFVADVTRYCLPVGGKEV